MPTPAPKFDEQFSKLFEVQYPQLYRCLDRLSGDADVADDLAQDAFVRLYNRRSMPDAPAAWLITVAMNLFRNLKSEKTRRTRLLTIERGEGVHSQRSPLPDAEAIASDSRARVRAALDLLTERDREMLLLRAEGYSYAEIAMVLKLNAASVGTLLSRAQKSFREQCRGLTDAR